MFREANKDELKAVADLYRKVYSEHPYNDRWTKANVRKKIKDLFNSGKMILALEKKEIIGFIMYQKETHDTFQRFFIHDLGVKKNFRGKGIASKLLLITEINAKKEKVSELELNSNIHSKAYLMYKNKGFKKTDWVVMNKRVL
jgi:ribosomal protein S18 acetylase RimI-like enzyme